MAAGSSKSGRGKRPYFLIIYVVIVALTVFFLVFNDTGYIKYLKVKGDKEKLESDTTSIRAENKRLEEEIDSLRRNEPAKIERLAREKYNMSRPNEIIIRVEKK
jgi:cell division protein FtsB